ncbi:MAG: hypothetical protein JWQ11_3695, partial [Rhizobacter sp.]|nr:hypothetical protein [Rhizobacter sp.]
MSSFQQAAPASTATSGLHRHRRHPRRAPEDRKPSQALGAEDSASTRLASGLHEQAAAHPGLTGILALPDAHGAFAARMLLARAAQRTLDIQYYIWHDDITGTLLLRAVHEAAERGVRVRLLLDDNGIAGLDHKLALLDTHANVEIRLFNPFYFRRFKAIGYLTNFRVANRRMHNKSFTADNAATIVGGRNVGDEYFGATEGVLFADLDVLAAGAVVPKVSEDFDRYWASASARAIDEIVRPTSADDARALVEAADKAARDPKATRYVEALKQSKVITDLVAGKLELEWSEVVMISDDPRKGLGKAARKDLVIERMKTILGDAKHNVELVSPYFVPGASGVDAFVDMARSGVKLRILTNALESTDVAAVHAGYAKRRHPLLRAGIELFELRRELAGGADSAWGPPPRTAPKGKAVRSSAALAHDLSSSSTDSAAPNRTARKAARRAARESSMQVAARPRGKRKTGKSGETKGSPEFAAPTKRAKRRKHHGLFGSSGSSLHAKTFSVDRERVFIGSFNFDPRSANLNTELGFVIDSTAMAAAMAERFATTVPARSYRVTLAP